MKFADQIRDERKRLGLTQAGADALLDTTRQLYANGLALPTNMTQAIWATVRIKKGTMQILDGRLYKTEDGMNRHRGSRPKNAVRIKIIRRLNHGLVEAEMLDA